MTVLQNFFLLVVLAAVSMGQRATAAVPWTPSGDSFGSGMHAYLAGNSAEAKRLFAQAIGRDSKDPRPHYFLGLCLLRLGRGDEARAEMLVGAALEARSPGSYAVGKSLERVQGDDRLMLEKYRRQARAERAVVRSELERTRYRAPAAAHADAAVLRQKVSIPLDQLVEPVTLAQWTHSAIESPHPIADVAPQLQAPSSATEKAENSAVDPFTNDPGVPPEGKIPSGKLMGIVGRALIESAPVPSLEDLRQYLHLPELPVPADSGAEPVVVDTFGADSGFAPVDDADPFAEPTAVPSDEESTIESMDSSDEDPFGGF